MSGTCSTHGDDKLTQHFSFENPKGRDNLRDHGASGRIILKWTLKNKLHCEDEGWIKLTQDRDQWHYNVIIIRIKNYIRGHIK
jgi:hypothetical protein